MMASRLDLVITLALATLSLAANEAAISQTHTRELHSGSLEEKECVQHYTKKECKAHGGVMGCKWKNKKCKVHPKRFVSCDKLKKKNCKARRCPAPSRRALRRLPSAS